MRLRVALSAAFLTLFAALFLALLAGPVRSQEQPVRSQEQGNERMEWWREARFGLFIHWGLYAIPAGKWGEATHHGEWILTTAQIPVEEYERLTGQFNPVEFDADEWVRIAKDAGMRYIVITSKHHDGFCLFESQQTEFDVMSTPFGRDILKELAEACRREGLRMCWYHSIMDWNHPDYLPRRGWEERSAEGADYDRYVRYMHAQVEELLTNYGPIGVMWFDGEWEGSWTHERGQELYELCRRLQPDVIVNNRVDKGRGGMAGLTKSAEYFGDFGTPEQEIPATGFPDVDWETCMTMNRHWGYNARDDSWKSTEDLIHKLVDIASKGGNFLLNVGPKADGTFPEPCVERLRGMGDWMRANGEAIYGTSASPFEYLPWGRCTMRRGRGGTLLYLHVFEWPEDGFLRVPGLGNQVRAARLLAGVQTPLPTTRRGGDVLIEVPGTVPDPVCTVVVLEITGEPIVYETPRIVAAADRFVHRMPVRLETRSTELAIHFTVDGSDPTARSPRYPAQVGIALEQSLTLKARAFHAGQPVSSIAERRFEKVAPIPAVEVTGAQAGLSCAYYRGDWDELPDFAALEAEETVTVPRVFPWKRAETPSEEYYGLRLSGWIEVPADEVYTFALNSDDGSRLTVAGRLVVDNDGLHGPQELVGSVPLAAGRHPLVVEWFNKTGGAALDLAWRPLGAEFQPVPESALTHAP